MFERVAWTLIPDCLSAISLIAPSAAIFPLKGGRS